MLARRPAPSQPVPLQAGYDRPVAAAHFGPRALSLRRQWYYFFLTDEGIEYLRNYLHVPADVVPATLKPRANVMRPGSERPEKRAGPGGNFQSDSVRHASAGRGAVRRWSPPHSMFCLTVSSLVVGPQRREGRGFRREYRE